MTRARTWQLEAAVAALVLAGVAIASRKGAIEWLGVAAVFVTFLHAQVADRMAAGAAARPSADVHCHRWSARYFVVKEALWLAYFAWLGAWSALAGCVLFLAYVPWRRWWRARGYRGEA